MTELSIDLEWWRDPRGYRIVDDARRVEGTTTILSAAGRRGARIVGLGGALVPYRPLNEFSGVLFTVFANKARDQNGVLGFVKQFGPLTQAGLGKGGEDIAQSIEHASAMRGWIEGGGNGRLPDLIGRGISFGRVKTVLTLDPLTQAPRLRLTVDSLRTGLWLQLAQSLAKGLPLRTCEYCSMPFAAGPGSGRRLDAKFCSDAHRIAFNSLRRSGRSSVSS